MRHGNTRILACISFPSRGLVCDMLRVRLTSEIQQWPTDPWPSGGDCSAHQGLHTHSWKVYIMKPLTSPLRRVFFTLPGALVYFMGIVLDNSSEPICIVLWKSGMSCWELVFSSPVKACWYSKPNWQDVCTQACARVFPFQTSYMAFRTAHREHD